MAEPATSHIDGRADEIAVLKSHVKLLSDSIKHVPWYKQVTSLISAMAFVVSLGTTGASFYASREQERRAYYQDLQETILKLGKLPRENVEISLRFANNPALLSRYSGLLNNENEILVRRASSIAERIPDLVTPAEHIAIANSLVNSRMLEAAQRHLETALAQHPDVEDQITAHRTLGAIAFATGNAEAGRQQFEAAKSERLGRTAGTSNEMLQWMDLITEVRWAQTVASRGMCADYRQHLDEARKILALLPAGFAGTMAQEIVQTDQAGCPPNPARMMQPAVPGAEQPRSGEPAAPR